MSNKARVVYWFRTDLRLHDSPALKAALDLNPEVLYPIWTWDPHYAYRARVGINRFQFLIDCQNDLSKSITKLNPKSKLFVIREAPQTLFPKLLKAWKITHLVFEKDVDGYGRQRDSEVIKLAKEAGVEVVVRSGRTLWDSDLLVEANSSKPTMSISQVLKAGPKVGEIPRPIPAPKSLPDPGNMAMDFDQEKPPSSPDFQEALRDGANSSYDSLGGPDNNFAPPNLAEFRMKPATTPHRGGETLALENLAKIIANKNYTATFEKPKTAPTDFLPQSTTLLSPHLHFGSLSIREFFWRVKDVVDSTKNASQPPASLLGQLYFRDMYFGAQAALGYNFAQTYNNSHIRFVPWHLPSNVDPDNKLITGSYRIDSAEAETWYRRWKFGRTGFPWIDALMRQLRSEGWIHHLGRHAVACFLTRGGCYVDWERGAEVFEEWLIDHETACNSGNWQWLSCTAFFAQFYRCYSPIAFPAKWDKEGDFVRRYVPELAHYDKKYIYEPWKAPIADQKKWKCLVKGDGGAADGGLDEEISQQEGCAVYPKPMFDFAKRRDVCIGGMKTAYRIGLYGNDKRVLDGTWRALFDDQDEGPTDGTEGPIGATLDDDHEDKDAMMDDHEGTGVVEGDEEGDDSASKSKKHSRSESGQQPTLDGHFKKAKT